MTTAESLRNIARLGITDVEVMLQAHSEYQDPHFRSLRQIANATGVNIHSVHALLRYHPVFDTYRARADEGWELFEQAAQGAAQLGATILVWHGACRNDRVTGVTDPQHMEAIDRLAGICANHGIVLGLENVSWCSMSQTRDVLAIAAAMGDLTNASSIGFTFDVFQAAEAGASPFMLLAAMEGRLSNVHIRDRRAGEPSRRDLLPGQGELPWPALVRAIAAAGFAGPLILEGSLDLNGTDLSTVRELLEPLIEAVETENNSCDGRLPPGVIAGIKLFNAGEFYACHEEIEHEWHAERGEIRQLYQGMLQVGVGFYHARSGNQRGAVLLLHDGIAKISRFLPRCRGIDTERLVRETSSSLDAIRDLDQHGAQLFASTATPRIVFVDEPDA